MRRVLICLLSLTFSALLQAQPLTDSDIRQWADGYKAVMAWASKSSIKEDVTAAQKTIQNNDIFGQLMLQAKANNYYQELAGVLQGSGYSDPQQWAVTGNRIFQAFMALQTGDDLDQQIQQMEAMINSAGLSPEQRAAMEPILQQGLATLKAVADTPAEDKEAVKRNEALLQGLFGM